MFEDKSQQSNPVDGVQPTQPSPSPVGQSSSAGQLTDPQPILPVQPKVEPDAEPTVMPKITEEKTEDIFKETDNMSSAPPQSGQAPPPSGPTEPLVELPDDLEEEGGGGKKFFWIGLIVVIVVLVVGVYYGYSKFFKGQDQAPSLNQNQPANLNQDVGPQANENVNIEPQANTNFNENVNQDIVGPAEEPKQEDTLDSDKDGLTDAEEAIYGTDPFEPDSDGDKLYDREEVKVYRTNPLNPDTDSDGFLDGEEVNSGYNPLGPGRLLELDLE